MPLPNPQMTSLRGNIGMMFHLHGGAFQRDMVIYHRSRQYLRHYVSIVLLYDINNFGLWNSEMPFHSLKTTSPRWCQQVFFRQKEQILQQISMDSQLIPDGG